MRLPVTNIQRFSTQDGPGIRTTVFLRGCPLSCKWCHNPETQSFHQQILYTEQYCIACGACVETCPVNAHYLNTDNIHCYDSSKCIGCLACSRVCPSNAIEPASRDMSTDEIMETVLSDKVFYGDKGGITLSGGEPLFHMEGCISLLESSKKANITTVIGTSGYFNESKIDELIHLTDLFLWDYKDGNSQRHLNYTGVHNQKILDNLFLADSLGAKTLLRCIMIKGVNMENDNFQSIAEVMSQLSNCQGLELLPYHAYGGSKYKQLGLEDNTYKDWIPTPSELEMAKGKLRSLGIKVIT